MYKVITFFKLNIAVLCNYYNLKFTIYVYCSCHMYNYELNYLLDAVATH